MRRAPRLTLVGGPTLLIEWNGLRLLTDPTFDPAGSTFSRGPSYTLRKTRGPALSAESLGELDAVLLSHDHHFDNLDDAGRAMLPRARLVLTTVAGAERLGGNARGLRPGDTAELRAPDSRVLRVTATPARHGPAGGDRGPVVGFLLSWADDPADALYISGDTVWYEDLEALAARHRVRGTVLFLGAAKVAVAGDQPLTMTADDAVRAARAFAPAAVVPVHYEGWEHFSQSRGDVERAFAAAGLSDRLRWLAPGVATPLADPGGGPSEG